MTTADRIKNRRIELGLTQLEVARRLGLTTKAAVSKVEQQGDNVTLKSVEKFAKALNCTKAYLMGWEDEEYKGKDIVDAEPFVAETPAYGATKANQPLTDKEKHFIECYSKLSEEQKMLVDSLMLSWLSKQESDPV